MAPSRAAGRLAASLVSIHHVAPRTPPASAAARAYPQLQLHRPALRTAPSPFRAAAAAAAGPARRSLSSSSGPEPPDYLSEAELHVFNKVKSQLEPVRLEVQDISGGCGSMYALDIESPQFKGLSVIKQHKLVNEVLKDEIKGWHGVQLRTKAPA